MNGYLFAFLLVMLVIVACLLVLGLIFWALLRQKARGRGVSRRVRPEREPEIDLGAVRWAFESRRDAYAEARQLRRIA